MWLTTKVKDQVRLATYFTAFKIDCNEGELNGMVRVMLYTHKIRLFICLFILVEVSKFLLVLI